MRSEIWKLIKKSLTGDEIDYTKGSIRSSLFLISVPMIIEMIMESLFAIVDVFFVAKISNDAVATIGLTESVLMLVESVAIGISVAATAMISRRIGEKDGGQAGLAAGQSILFGLLLSFVIGIAAYYYADRILVLMGGSPELVAQGQDYTRVILSFNVVLMMLFIHNAIFRSSGNPVIAMRSLWLANGINIILDPCLIFGLWIFPELGLTGAAIASTIGRGTGVLYQIYYLSKFRLRNTQSNKERIYLSKSHFIPSFQVMFKIFRLTIGGAGQFLISTASWLFMMRILAGFGSSILAGFTIGLRIIVFSILPSWGLANATATLVGQNLGANQADRAEKTVWLSAKYNVVFMCFISILFFVFASSLIDIFTNDPVVIKEGTLFLRILSLGYIFYSYQMIIGQAFNGAGDTYTPTYLNIICFWVVQIPLAYYLALHTSLGSLGVYVAIALSSSLMAVLAIIIFRRGKWKLHQI